MDSFKIAFNNVVNYLSKNMDLNDIALHLAHVALYEQLGFDALYPDFKTLCTKLEANMQALGKPIVFVEGFRSAKRQSLLYAQGRTVNGSIITNALPMQSLHQTCLAADYNFKAYGYNPPVGWWTIYGQEAKKLGLIWGGDSFGDFHDYPHVQWPRFTWQQLQDYFK